MSGLSAGDRFHRAKLRMAAFGHRVTTSPIRQKCRHCHMNSFSGRPASASTLPWSGDDVEDDIYEAIINFVDSIQDESLYWHIIGFAPEAFCRGSARALETWRSQRLFARPLKPYQIPDSLKRSPNLRGLCLEQPFDGGPLLRLIRELPHLSNLSLLGGQLDKCPKVCDQLWSLVAGGKIEKLRFGDRAPKGTSRFMIGGSPRATPSRPGGSFQPQGHRGYSEDSSCCPLLTASYISAQTSSALLYSPARSGVRPLISTYSSSPLPATRSGRVMPPVFRSILTLGSNRAPLPVVAEWNLNLSSWRPLKTPNGRSRLEELCLQGVQVDFRQTQLPLLSSVLERLRLQNCNLGFDKLLSSQGALDFSAAKLKQLELDSCWTNDWWYFVQGAQRAPELECLMVAYPKVHGSFGAANHLPADSWLFVNGDHSAPIQCATTLKAALFGKGVEFSDYSLAHILVNFPNVRYIVAANHVMTESSVDAIQRICVGHDFSKRLPCIILSMGSCAVARRVQDVLRGRYGWRTVHVRAPPDRRQVIHSKSSYGPNGSDSTEGIQRRLLNQISENENRYRLHKMCIRIAARFRSSTVHFRHPLLTWRRSNTGRTRDSLRMAEVDFESLTSSYQGPVRLPSDFEAGDLWFDAARELPSGVMDNATAFVPVPSQVCSHKKSSISMAFGRN